MPQTNELLGKCIMSKVLGSFTDRFCLILFQVAAASYIKYEYVDKLWVYIFQSLKAFIY